MNLNNLKVKSDASILDALTILNELLYKESISRLILFVVDENDTVIGSLTDGDIRRALIKNQDLTQPVSEICNQEFIHSSESGEFIDLKTYRQQNIKMLPILNGSKKLVEIIDLDQTKSKLPLECIIMAGGRGKRLSPLTDTIPKPMLNLDGKPIIEHNIDRLISFGIKKLYISVKYLGEQIESYFGDGSSKGIEIEYIWENKPLGTAGAMSLVDNFKSDHVLLMNSDLFTNVDFEDLYLDLIKNNADMAVASTEYKVDIPYAIFETEENVVKAFKEKPSYIYHSNAGIYILKKELIEQIPKNTFYDITDLMEVLVSSGGKLIFNPIVGFWIDIGSPADYKRAQEFIKH